MQGLWDGFEGRGFAAWLPSFYDAVLNAASSEARWCASALPDSHPGLLLQLLSALFSRIEKPFRTRLGSALVQGVSFLLCGLCLESVKTSASRLRGCRKTQLLFFPQLSNTGMDRTSHLAREYMSGVRMFIRRKK